ncbi:hypothetical protein OAF45_03430 [Candidatus Latescibacteria bacterium]|nr:hypothetical protein [Candidatus Latescibacterota bacterium]
MPRLKGLASSAFSGFAFWPRGGAIRHLCDRHVKTFEVLPVESIDGFAGSRLTGHVDLSPTPPRVDGDSRYRAEEFEECTEVVFSDVASEIVYTDFH